MEHLPTHATPSPVYPWLQVQVKPPGVLVQVALVLQLLSSGEAHSSKSIIWHGRLVTRVKISVVDLTFAGTAISSVSLVTGTGEATRSVGTDSIKITVMTPISTLINI